MWPNTALERTPVAPVSFRFEFRVGPALRDHGGVAELLSVRRFELLLP